MPEITDIIAAGLRSPVGYRFIRTLGYLVLAAEGNPVDNGEGSA
jgi:hypothetical protein